MEEVENVKSEIDIEFIENEMPNAIEQSLQGVEHVAKLVLSMKEFSRPGSGKIKLVDINRTIKKRYVALLDGNLSENKGTIKLPLRVDLEDRPKQLVDFEYGKNAKTNWEVIQRENGKTRVYFYPITGRTHQLRVHAAHKDGLNTPIIGDDLYGKKTNRLHLHAEFIEFMHPFTNKKMSFTVAADF